MTTREERSLYEAAVARKARAIHRRTGAAGPRPSSNDARAAAGFMVDILVTLAAKGDARAAIHLDERLHGRVKYQLEHGGIDGAAPIPVQPTGPVELVFTLGDPARRDPTPE